MESILFSFLQLGKDYPVTVEAKQGLKVTDLYHLWSLN